ncbi:hypothetical protein IW261DRAFT_1519586 [Armillaria novae-zelandiae]|uniref:Secreted protein n=1 Tax=Armillaria novae-zelandiae TaxID=153914 RepID=A0AA39NKY5_9AGAR|nr:hypothetical protein IW261DRAFT_1519586 [Armillaria novae-zelandiae]
MTLLPAVWLLVIQPEADEAMSSGSTSVSSPSMMASFVIESTVNAVASVTKSVMERISPEWASMNASYHALVSSLCT